LLFLLPSAIDHASQFQTQRPRPLLGAGRRLFRRRKARAATRLPQRKRLCRLACTGIALAALLLFGYRLGPAIFVGAFLVNFTTAGTVLTSLGIASGNTLEALAGCYLVTRFAAGRNAFQRSQNIFKFVLLAGMVSTAISASIGSATLVFGHLAEATHYLSIWLTWWLGDSVGALVLTRSSWFGLKSQLRLDSQTVNRTHFSFRRTFHHCLVCLRQRFSFHREKLPLRISLFPVSGLGRVSLWP